MGLYIRGQSCLWKDVYLNSPLQGPLQVLLVPLRREKRNHLVHSNLLIHLVFFFKAQVKILSNVQKYTLNKFSFNKRDLELLMYTFKTCPLQMAISWMKWQLKSSRPNRSRANGVAGSERAVTLTDECVFGAVGRDNGWESPWRRCIWSLGIHATSCPVSPDWSKWKGPARLFQGTYHVPGWQMQSPGKAAGPRLHLCRLLIETICAQFSFYFHWESRAYSARRVATGWLQDQTTAWLYSYKLRVNKVLLGSRCRAQLQRWVTSQFDLLITFWLAFRASRLQ